MAEAPQWPEYPDAVGQSPTGSLLDSLGYLPAAAVGATAGGSLAYLLRRRAAKHLSRVTKGALLGAAVAPLLLAGQRLRKRVAPAEEKYAGVRWQACADENKKIARGRR